MTEQLSRPTRRNPLARTRLPVPLGGPRSRAAQGLTQAAAEGVFRLQVCTVCRAATYPPRDVCPRCLSGELVFEACDPHGVLVAETRIDISGEVHFRERAPWRIGSVRMDCGPMVVAHLHGGVAQGQRVRMTLMLDKTGGAAMVALPATYGDVPPDDRVLREFTCDPKFRRVLVTDGRSSLGQAMVTALREAGAAEIFVGVADGWKPFGGEAALRAQAGVSPVVLDLTDTQSVMECASQIGGRVDIIVNTAEHVRAGGVMAAQGVSEARAALELRSLGLMRLAQGFGPIMRMRGADGVDSACALVNVLAVHALMNWPEFGVASAAEAAALSMSQCLRAEFRGGGIRVLNVFAGPQDTEWFQTVPAPKVAPMVLARAVVAALRGGGEDCFVGDVAEDYRARLAANAKALERELGA